MNSYLVLGAAGFLGKSLIDYIKDDPQIHLTLFDKADCKLQNFHGTYVKDEFSIHTDFEQLTKRIDIVFHLISTSRPGTKFLNIFDEVSDNVAPTLKLLDACVKNHVKQIIFISSGGTVYGVGHGKANKETDITNPICSYGIQKLMIEKYIQLYFQSYGLDYRIIRLSNPYGQLQNPLGGLGAVTTFTYQAFHDQPIQIAGDGTVVRDYIYIEDAIKGILNISKSNGHNRLFNLGSGVGHSLNHILNYLQNTLDKKLNVTYQLKRGVDVPYNILDISRYRMIAPDHTMWKMEDGIKQMIQYYTSESR